MFDHDDGTFISITSHSGFITAMLAVLGHRPFPLGTGQAIPVIVERKLPSEPIL
jgi:hypothetical protein